MHSPEALSVMPGDIEHTQRRPRCLLAAAYHRISPPCSYDDSSPFLCVNRSTCAARVIGSDANDTAFDPASPQRCVHTIATGAAFNRSHRRRELGHLARTRSLTDRSNGHPDGQPSAALLDSKIVCGRTSRSYGYLQLCFALIERVFFSLGMSKNEASYREFARRRGFMGQIEFDFPAAGGLIVASMILKHCTQMLYLWNLVAVHNGHREQGARVPKTVHLLSNWQRDR